jgi:hypothetical protein
MIAAALEVEVERYVASLAGEVGEDGKRLGGLSSGIFVPALGDLLGQDAVGLSPSSIQCLAPEDEWPPR